MWADKNGPFFFQVWQEICQIEVQKFACNRA
jgi:hypothetical protein